MSCSVRLGDGSAVVFDAIQGRESQLVRPGVLLTLEGKRHGELLNCALIPTDKVGQVIEALQLVAAEIARG